MESRPATEARKLRTLDLRWTPPFGVQVACTTRAGGISAAPYDSLNLGVHVGDRADAVAENRRRLRAELELPAEPLWLEQVHGAEVVELAEPRASMRGARADALVTRERGAVAAIQVADCLPVLFASRDGCAIGAAHAGWRGLAAGVLERTIEALGRLDAAAPTLEAWIGPGIGAAHFEVGPEVVQAFAGADPGAASYFVANARGRWQCDLVGLARRRLERCGITRIAGGHWCTYADAARFYSHRRGAPTGRMAALIWIEAALRDRAGGARGGC